MKDRSFMKVIFYSYTGKLSPVSFSPSLSCIARGEWQYRDVERQRAVRTLQAMKQQLVH